MTSFPHFDPRPMILEGRHARLEPLTREHAGDLLVAGDDEAIWRYLPVPWPRSSEAIGEWIGEALADAQSGAVIPFAVVHRKSGSAVGSTRFLDIQRPHRSLEIGWTWIGVSHQRTALNTECKYLLMGHAFEVLGAIRICLKTDSRNVRSQEAIERIGAVREGVLRNHMILWDGYVRDSAYFSITAAEWPRVKRRLEEMLAR